MYYDKDMENIEIYDNVQKKMLIFDLEGNLVESKRSCISFISFTKIKNNYYVYSPFVNHKNSSGFNLFLLDGSLSKIKKKFLPTRNNFDRALFTGNFTQNDDETFFRHGLNDTIYKLTENGVEPFLLIDFGKHKVPYSKIKNITNSPKYDETVYFKEPPYLGQIGHVLANDDELWFRFTEVCFGEKAFFSGIYKRKNDSVSFYGAFKSKIPELFAYYPVQIDNTKRIYSVSPHELESSQLNVINKKYNLKIDENSNPLIIYQYE